MPIGRGGSLGRTLLIGVGVTPPKGLTPTTPTVAWSATNKSTLVALGNSNLTATPTTDNGAPLPVPADTVKTTGKHYFEIRVYIPLFQGFSCGVSDGGSHVNSTNPGAVNNRGVSFHSNGNVYFNSTTGSQADYSSLAGFRIVGVAVDADANKVWFSVDGVFSGDPVAGTGGYATGMTTGYTPLASPFYIVEPAELRATADRLTYAIPTGYAAFDTGVVSADVTRALTGQTLTVAQGSTAPATNVALTGQALAVNQGFVTAGSDVTAALSGQTLTVAIGSLTASRTLGLTGQSLTIAQGSVTTTASILLAGQALTAAQGSVAPSISPALTGQAIVVSLGFVTAGADVTVALTGQSITAAQGSIVSAKTVLLTGQALTAGQGSVAAQLSVALSGHSIVAAFGSLGGAPTGGNIKVRIGATWTPKPVKVWNAGTWTQRPLKRWNGTAWVRA